MLINRSVLVGTGLLLSACAATPLRHEWPQSQVDEFERVVAASPGQSNCQGSLKFELPKALRRLGDNGVSAESPGVYLVTAGDNYHWVSVEYLGIVNGRKMIVGSAKNYIMRVDETLVRQAEVISQDSSPASRTGRVHDGCESLIERLEDGALEARRGATDSADLTLASKLFKAAEARREQGF